MKEQIMLAKGRYADLKRRLHQLELKAENLRVQIGILFSPYELNAVNLDTERGLQAAKDLHKVVTEMKTVRAEMEKIEEILN